MFVELRNHFANHTKIFSRNVCTLCKPPSACGASYWPVFRCCFPTDPPTVKSTPVPRCRTCLCARHPSHPQPLTHSVLTWIRVCCNQMTEWNNNAYKCCFLDNFLPLSFFDKCSSYISLSAGTVDLTSPQPDRGQVSIQWGTDKGVGVAHWVSKEILLHINSQDIYQ